MIATSSANVAALCVLFGALSSCSRFGDPPPGWFKEPITGGYMCSETAGVPGPSVKRSKAIIQRALSAGSDDIRMCHDELLSRIPEGFGRIEVRFLITPEGEVRSGCIVEATLNDRPMAACILRAMERLIFEPASGYEVVRLPLRFELKLAPSYLDIDEPTPVLESDPSLEVMPPL